MYKDEPDAIAAIYIGLLELVDFEAIRYVTNNYKHLFPAQEAAMMDAVLKQIAEIEIEFAVAESARAVIN